MFAETILIGMAAWAQPAQSTGPPVFEVAAIKANHSGERIQSFNPARGGRFTAANCSLRLLIEYAFQLRRYQISGAPDWVSSERYDFAAKAEGNPQSLNIPGMVQRLLEDRFQLRMHWETREAAGYNLVVSKPGKLRESEPGDCPSNVACGYLPNTPGHTGGHQVSSANLADALAFFIQAFVVDKTSLTGRYDIELQWTPEPALIALPLDEPASPSIFTALQERLGLKLESSKAQIKTLIIDHVERPSEN